MTNIIVIDKNNPNFPKELTDPLNNTEPIPFPVPPRSEEPRVFVLSIGVNNSNPEAPLYYADKDAQDFSDNIIKKYPKQQIHSLVLKNAQANNRSIQAAFRWLEESTNKRDEVFVLFSGHGVVDYRTQRYYYLSYEPLGRVTNQNLISDVWIGNLISHISGNLKLFLDTCYSNNFNDYLFVHIPIMRAKNFSSFASSLSWYPSYEDMRTKNGYFTATLLEVLNDTLQIKENGLDISQKISFRLSQIMPISSHGLQQSSSLHYF